MGNATREGYFKKLSISVKIFCSVSALFLFYMFILYSFIWENRNFSWCFWSKSLTLTVSKEGIFLPVWMFLQIFRPEHCLNYISQMIPDSQWYPNRLQTYQLRKWGTQSWNVKRFVFIKTSHSWGIHFDKSIFFFYMDTSNVLKIFGSKAIHDILISSKKTISADLQRTLRRGRSLK